MTDLEKLEEQYEHLENIYLAQNQRIDLMWTTVAELAAILKEVVNIVTKKKKEEEKEETE